jgi:hypothetical protein
LQEAGRPDDLVANGNGREGIDKVPF